MTGNIQALVFSAAGAGGFLQLGVLQTLRKQHVLPGVRKLVGTSASSMVAFIAALDICPKEVMKSVISYEGAHSLLFSIRISKLFTDFGLDDGDYLFDFIFRLLDRFKPGCSRLTFVQLLQQSGKELHIPATCVTTGLLVLMSPDTTPDLRIASAIRASCAIPLIFTSPIIDNKRFCDGGLLAYNPVSFVEEVPQAEKIGVLILPDDNREDVQDVLAYTARVIRLYLHLPPVTGRGTRALDPRMQSVRRYGSHHTRCDCYGRGLWTWMRRGT